MKQEAIKISIRELTEKEKQNKEDFSEINGQESLYCNLGASIQISILSNNGPLTFPKYLSTSL